MKQRVIDASRDGSTGARLVLDLLGYGGHWTRRRMNDDITSFLEGLPIEELDVAEISGRLRGSMSWQSYESLQYPAFDVCADGHLRRESFDLVFCEQVLEHVWKPADALLNIREMLRPGGLLIVSTPFLIRVHRCPEDFWRFTPDCLQRMLEESDLEVERLDSWGNKRCVSADLGGGAWTKYRPLRSLRNEADVPVVVWAFARRPDTDRGTP